MFHLSKMFPSSSLLNHQSPWDCSGRPSIVVGYVNQHPGSPSPAYSCPTPDLHTNAPERPSSLNCELMLWSLHTYPKLISYYPAFTLVSTTYLPLILALNPNLAVHPSQSQDIRGVFYWALYLGSSHPQPLSDPSRQIFTLGSPSLASHEL